MPGIFTAVAGMWDGAFYLLALLFLAYQTWRGWRMGIVRAGLRLLALVASGIVGWYGGVYAAEVVGRFASGLGFVAGVAIGFVLAIAIYIALTLASMFFFKKTQDNSSSLVRWFYGAGGAVMGFLIGVVFVWAAVSGVRALGGIAQGRQEAGQNSAAGGALAGLRQSVEGDGAGGLLRKIDPLPDSLYAKITKFSEVTANPAAMARLVEYPQIAEILSHPKFLALTNDPEIQRAALQHNVLAIMFNPKLLELATDPEIIEAARRIDLDKALNFALQQEASSQESQSSQTPGQ